MMYLSIVVKPDSAILEKEIIETGVIKYILKTIRREDGNYETPEEEVDLLIKKQIDVSDYVVVGKDVDLKKFKERGQFKIIHFTYDSPAGLKHLVVTNAVAFIMNNDGRTMDSVSCI